MSWLVETPDGVVLTLRVIPRAAKEGFTEVLDDAVKVKVSAPAMEGRANKAVLALVADALGVRKRNVALVSGGKARTKRILIEGVAANEIRHRVLALTDGTR